LQIDATGARTFQSAAISDSRTTAEFPGTLETAGVAADWKVRAPADDKSIRPALADWLQRETGLSETGSQQLAEYFSATYQSLGVVPSQRKIVLERFFDESGGMQLVIHSPFGIRINRAW